MDSRDFEMSPGALKSYKPKKHEPYMNQAMQDYFRAMLNQMKTNIMSSSDLTIGHMKNERIQYADELDLAAQEEAFRLELRERDRERKLLKNIERSLDAIDQHDYGYCESCGTEIGFDRLTARPTATMWGTRDFPSKKDKNRCIP